MRAPTRAHMLSRAASTQHRHEGGQRTEDHFDELVEALAPQGALGIIDDPASPLDIIKLKPKSISLHREFMFTRARYEAKASFRASDACE
jgi:hypothetical protein